MPNFEILSNFKSLLDKYEVFVLDVFGIIYDGVTPFDEALALIKEIRSSNKRVVLLSNSPRRSSVVEARMAKIGLEISSDDILTSGECFYREVSQNPQLASKKIFMIGNDASMLDGYSFNIVDNIAEADYLYFSLLSLESDFDQYWQDKINQAIALAKPAICVNPDDFIFEQDKVVYTAGHYARIYQALGGEVLYYGKPYRMTYDHLASYIGNFNEALMIGDALATDIKGANDAGLDSLWVLKRGIHKLGFVDTCDSSLIFKQCHEYGAFPTYVMEYLFVS